MKPITIEEMFALPRKQFIDRFHGWLLQFNNGEHIEITNPLDCPLHSWVVYNKAKCSQDVVANTMSCPICGHPCCPDCMNHNVEQLSRVTGYMSNVGSWGAAKQQEFRDRQRHNVG